MFNYVSNKIFYYLISEYYIIILKTKGLQAVFKKVIHINNHYDKKCILIDINKYQRQLKYKPAVFFLQNYCE